MIVICYLGPYVVYGINHIVLVWHTALWVRKIKKFQKPPGEKG